MLPADDPERVPSISELLTELYTLRAAASGPEDWHRVRQLEEKVHRTVWQQAVPNRPDTRLGDVHGKAKRSRPTAPHP
jgi:hypothetical protein